MATLAIYVLALRPAFLEKAATFTFATILRAVCDVLGPLFPLVFVTTRCTQIVGFSFLPLPRPLSPPFPPRLLL